MALVKLHPAQKTNCEKKTGIVNANMLKISEFTGNSDDAILKHLREVQFPHYRTTIL